LPGPRGHTACAAENRREAPTELKGATDEPRPFRPHAGRRVPARAEIDALIASQAAWAVQNGLDPRALEIIDMWSNEIDDPDGVELTAWTPAG
jgi:hypothetical protein